MGERSGVHISDLRSIRPLISRARCLIGLTVVATSIWPFHHSFLRTSARNGKLNDFNSRINTLLTANSTAKVLGVLMVRASLHA